MSSIRHTFFGSVFCMLTAVLLWTGSAAAQQNPTPKAEIFGGYSWADPNTQLGPVKIGSIPKGFAVSATFNAGNHWGLTLDGSGHYADIANASTIMAGPRFIWRGEHVQPFLHALAGLHRLSPAGLGTDNNFGLKLGGGLDIPLSRLFSFELIRADYVFSRHNFQPIVTGTENSNGAQISTGLVLKLGGGAPPPPLSAACQVQPESVMAGEPVTVTATASNIPKNHTVTYSFNSTGGKVQPNNNSASVDTTGLNPGSYTVTATVTDKKAKKNAAPATCNSSFTIQEPPKHPPTISCSTNPTTIQSGQPVQINCTGQSPDNRPLTYNFTTSAGRLTPNGANATLDTAGLPAGPVSVSATVTDDRGLNASTTTTANVEVPPPPPQASKLNEIQFNDKRRPARVDNVAKAILDDIALRLQRDADAKAVIVGNCETGENQPPRRGRRAAPAPEPGVCQVAEERAINTKAYLTQEKGIDPGRIEVRTGNSGTRSAEIWLVPSGATFNQQGTNPFDESTVKPQAERRRPARRARPASKTAPKTPQT